MLRLLTASLVPLLALGTQGTDAPSEFGSGKDGNLTVPLLNFDVNHRGAIQNAVVAPGANVVVTLNASASFKKGEEVLILQMQGGRPGIHEFATVVAAATSGSVTLDQVRYTYHSGSFGLVAPNAKSAQLVSVPHFDSVVVTSTSSIRPAAFDGTKGGVTAFRVRGRLTLDGPINASRRGFRPGANWSGPIDQGEQGESVFGLGAFFARPNDSGGGGGRTSATSLDGAGGGGAGHLGSGRHGRPHGSSTGGGGGAPTASGPIAWLHFGSGGGAGSSDTNPLESSYAAGRGGAGGGIVFVAAREIVGGGLLEARGEDGVDAGNGFNDPENGGGGGGSGGTIWVIVGNDTPVRVDVAGGDGGAASHSGATCSGGRGSPGVAVID